MERQLRGWLRYCTYFGIYVGVYMDTSILSTALQHTPSTTSAAILRLTQGDATPSAHNGANARQYAAHSYANAFTYVC